MRLLYWIQDKTFGFSFILQLNYECVDMQISVKSFVFCGKQERIWQSKNKEELGSRD